MKKLYLIGALALAALLAGCGGGSSHGGDNGSGSGGGVPPPVAMLDAFYAAVSNAILTTGEDKEGIGIDAIMATSPEDTEPVPF